MRTAIDLQSAIIDSQTYSEPVKIEVENIDNSIMELSQIWNGSMDSILDENCAGENFVDIWGWDHDTPENEMEWRISLHLIEPNQ